MRLLGRVREVPDERSRKAAVEGAARLEVAAEWVEEQVTMMADGHYVAAQSAELMRYVADVIRLELAGK